MMVAEIKTQHWKRYASAAVVELVAAQIGREEDAQQRLQMAWENVERAMESIEEEREEQHGDN